MMPTFSRILIGAMLLATAATAAFAEEGGVRLDPAPTQRLDVESLQRGARNFTNYCLGCHSAQYMRYNRLSALGLSEKQITDNLMFVTDKPGNTMVSAMTKADASAWFGAAPPDLSVEARVRGKDWLYSYLNAFYRDPTTTTGWNNLVFPHVGMPHVLWNLSGSQKLVETEFDDEEKAEAAVIAAKTLAIAERDAKGKYVVKTLALDTPGSLSTTDYKMFVADLVNYMEFMAEPARNERLSIGIVVLIYLGLLFGLAYALKRNYWKEIH
jgi:ubiquinol-cytochrome c reductase cytochrome c1 subunit